MTGRQRQRGRDTERDGESQTVTDGQRHEIMEGQKKKPNNNANNMACIEKIFGDFPAKGDL